MTFQILFQAGNHRVVAHGHDGEDAGGAALLSDHGKAVLDGLLGAAVFNGLAVHPQFSALARGAAEDVFQQLRAPGAIQAGNAQDLALLKLERHVLEPGVHGREILDLEHHVGSNLIILGREAVGQLAAHHEADDLVHGELLGGTGGDPLAVAHDGDLVGDAQDLLHLVGDVHNAAAAVAQHVDNLEKMLDLLLGQRGGGLVKDDDLGVEGNRLGDFHHLALRYGHGAHDGLGVDADVKLLEDLHGVLIHLFF